MKSYNQQYKESGTTLTYKEWRKREDEKMASFDGYPSIKLDTSALEQAKEELLNKGGLKSKISSNKTLGIPNYVLVLGGLLIVSAIGYKIYKNRK
jgi:hypothetical protein